jgi:hypothetical protein
MASTYSDLKIELIGTGEQTGTWGTTTNDNFSIAIGEAITGSADVAFSSADVTVTLTNTNASQAARNLRLNLTGTSGGARQLILGSGCQIEKLYLVNNGLADAVTVKNTSGTGIVVPAGKSMFVYNNGTNVVDAITYLSAIGTGVFDAGTVSAPSITFTGDTNTGIYSPAADTIGFTEGGVEGLRINSNGQTSTSIAGTASLPSFTRTGDENTGIFFPAADTIAFTEGGVEAMRIADTSNVGIGTTAPVSKFVVKTGTNQNFCVRAGSDVSGTGITLDCLNDANSAVVDLTLRGTNMDLYGAGSTPMVFRTNSTERMRIDSSGNVGIGTTTMAGKLNVNTTGGNSRVAIGDTAASTYSTVLMYGGSGKFNFQLGVQNNVNNAFEITPSTATGGTTFSTPALVVDSSGNVGIGTNTTSGANLTVNASSLSRSRVQESSTNVIVDTLAYLSAGYIGTSSNHPFLFTTNGTERMRITSAGNLGLGTSAPNGRMETVTPSGTQNNLYITQSWSVADNDNYGAVIFGHDNATFKTYRSAIAGYKEDDARKSGLRFYTSSTSVEVAERMRIDSSGNVGIGVTIPTQKLDVAGNVVINAGGGNTYLNVVSGTSSLQVATDGSTQFIYGTGAVPLTFSTNAAERMRISSAGNVGIGTTADTYRLDVQRATGNNAIARFYNGSAGGNTDIYVNNVDNAGDWLISRRSGGEGWSYMSGANPLVFLTNSAERMRIHSSGNVTIGKTAIDSATAGCLFLAAGEGIFAAADAEPLTINRITSDGTLVSFRQDNTQEGTISVSGTTVSYNGGHLSRWSQLPDGSKDDAILKGTVMSNLDDMCVWEKDGVVAENEQLNKMKVSDVEGDTNVAGVFVNWTMDEQYGVDDMNVAMTGDMIIRIADGVVVQKGDLLMSAGDGTAKPQGDDIVRSKTIAKVTSNYVTCTYADGSYCVPCVLMAC